MKNLIFTIQVLRIYKRPEFLTLHAMNIWCDVDEHLFFLYFLYFSEKSEKVNFCVDVIFNPLPVGSTDSSCAENHSDK